MNQRQKKNRLELRFAGSGGQGLLTSGFILAYALGICEDKEVIQTQSYGPEARGGSSRADVIFSDQKIYNPHIESLDLLLCLNQESCDKYAHLLDRNGTLIIDTGVVKPPPDIKSVGGPFSRLAKDKLKKELVTNIIALGFIGSYTHIVSQNSLKKALQAKFGSRFQELNQKALALGFKIGEATLSEYKV